MRRPFLQFIFLLAVFGCQAGPRTREDSSSVSGAPVSSASQTSVAPNTSSRRFAKVSTGLEAAPVRLPSYRPQETAQPSAVTVRLAAARQPQGPETVGSPPSAGTGKGPAGANDSQGATQATESSSALSLGNVLAMGLSQNPDLIALRGTANVGQAAVEVAGVYPWNPFVQAQYLPNAPTFTPGPPGSASGQSSYYIWAMQRFELAHQRRHREDSAVAALGQMRCNIRQAELTNIAQSERLFFTALYQRDLLDLAADTETLSNRLGGIIERRFKAGLATNLQMINIRVAIRQARRQRNLADAAYQAALLALRQQLGMGTTAPLELRGDLAQYEWFSVATAACRISDSAPSDPQALAQELAEARPDVLASRSAIAVAQANMSLARAARVPDVQAGPIYDTADDGSKFIGLRLQRDFAVFNNGSALANQRQVEVQQQRLAFEQLKRRAANEAAAAIDRYERARRFAAEAAQDAADSPPAELEQALGQFEAGNAEIVDVLAVQNNLLQEARSYLDLVNEVTQSAALVTQTTAVPPERLVALRPPKFLESDAK